MAMFYSPEKDPLGPGFQELNGQMTPLIILRDVAVGMERVSLFAFWNLLCGVQNASVISEP
jgi:hypothetical protein